MKFQYIFFLLFLISCSKELDTIDNLSNNKISIIGHGGMGNKSPYPINSLESITKCLETGADGVEIDVQLTMDSVLIAFHSTRLESDTKIPGLVNEYNWDQIKTQKYISASHLPYDILKLEDLLTHIGNSEISSIVLDCKTNSGNPNRSTYIPTYARTIDSLIAKTGLKSKFIVETQDTQLLDLLKSNHSDLRIMFYPTSFEEGLQVATKMQLYGITISTKSINKDQVKKAHENGLRVAIWNVNSKKTNIEATNKSPDYIQTDMLRDLVRLVK